MSYPPFMQSRQHKVVTGDAGGDIGALSSTSVSTFASSNFLVELSNVQVGDTLIINWKCAVDTTADLSDVIFFAEINSNTPTSTDDDLIIVRDILRNADPNNIFGILPHTITAGDIDSNGRTSVEVLYRVTAGTLTIANSFGGKGLPHLIVSNIGPQDPT